MSEEGEEAVADMGGCGAEPAQQNEEQQQAENEDEDENEKAANRLAGKNEMSASGTPPREPGLAEWHAQAPPALQTACELEGGERTPLKKSLQRTKDDDDDVNTGDTETPSPLPRVIRLGSDASEEVTSWYAETFSNELTELKRSIKKASKSAKRMSRSPDTGNSRRTIGSLPTLTDTPRSRSSTQDSGAAASSGDHALSAQFRDDGAVDDFGSSASSAMATKLEVALMEAQEHAETQAREKDLLEQRLLCLEEIEELRMKLATFELQAIMEQQTDRLASAPPRWASDDDTVSCQRCELPFTFLRRRHHCRRCGRCLCAECAPRENQAPIPHFGYHTPVRQCLDCLPPEDSAQAKSPAKQGLAFTSVDKKPYSSAVDGIRRMENTCLRNPTSENLVLTLQSYVHAVERIAKSDSLRDRAFRRLAHATLLKSMRTFLQMPQVQGCMRDENTQHAALVESVLTPSTPPSPAAPATAADAET